MTAHAMSNDSSPEFNTVFGLLPTTVFETMSRLANEYKSINLGQGFPDRELEGPSSMKSIVFKSMQELSNQYPSLGGVPELRHAVADHSRHNTGLQVNPDTEVLITVGATEGLASAFLGLLNPGDEVIVFAPMYDSYIPMIERAGATFKTIQLRPPSWSFDFSQLEEAFIANKTKLIVLNTPHNPTGKVFNLEELERIAALCLKYNVYAILDEVYEHLVYPGYKHTTLRSLPGMEDRCIRIGSAGKTFSFTDFKVGWITGPSNMVGAATKAHQFLVFTVNSAIQRSVAHGLTDEQEFYHGLGAVLAKKRSVLEQRLINIGFKVLPAQGTYFLVADYSGLVSESLSDVEFCYKLTKEAGVTLIPVSAFYQDPSTAPKTLVRFVFCKTDEKLEAACEALESHFSKS